MPPKPLKATDKFPRATSTPKAPQLTMSESTSHVVTGAAWGAGRKSMAPSPITFTSSAANRSKAPVRGVTPTKRGALAAAGPPSYLPEGVPELDLSSEENLQILERLAAGDFKSGDGLWEQFLDPIYAKRDPVKKEDTQQAKGQGGSRPQQNLSVAFASLEMNKSVANRTTILAPGNRTIQSTGNRTIQSTGNRTTNQAPPPLEKVTDEETLTSGEDSDHYSPPIWMTRLEELIDAIEGFKGLRKRINAAILEGQFAEFLPPDEIRRFIKRMEVAIENLKIRTEHNFIATSKFFYQSNSSETRPNLPAPVEEHEAIIATINGLSDTLQKLNVFFGDADKEISFEEMVDTLGTLVDETEENIKVMEVNLKTLRHYSAVAKALLDKKEAEKKNGKGDSKEGGKEGQAKVKKGRNNSALDQETDDETTLRCMV